MKTAKVFNINRVTLIVFLTVVVVVGTCQTSWSEKFTCSAPGYAMVTCVVDGSLEKSDKIIFTCNMRTGDPIVRTCSRVFTPIPGLTYTGIMGYNWQCGADITVHDTALRDKKAMCSKLCGICDGKWD